MQRACPAGVQLTRLVSLWGQLPSLVSLFHMVGSFEFHSATSSLFLYPDGVSGLPPRVQPLLQVDYKWAYCFQRFLPALQVVYEWARGTPFEEICELTDVMEGSIVRTIVRLDEVCREFRDAARVMGNTQLFQQMEQASAAIKRDVIFAASLYVA